MTKLINIELKKIFSYKTFWVFSALYVILLPLLFTSVGNINFNVNAKTMALKMLYNFPNLWHNLTYFASWFNILLYLLVILLVTNEFLFKTARQNIIDGLSKAEFILAKLLLILVFSAVATVFLIIVGLICGYSFSEAFTREMLLEKASYLPAFFLQSFAYMTFALFISVLFKRQGFALIFFLLYAMIIESIIGLRMPGESANYLPLEAFSNLIRNPFGATVGLTVPPAPEKIYIILSLIYSLVFSGLSLAILEKTDN
jgi:ABC-2 type transport system permease protein